MRQTNEPRGYPRCYGGSTALRKTVIKLTEEGAKPCNLRILGLGNLPPFEGEGVRRDSLLGFYGSLTNNW